MAKLEEVISTEQQREDAAKWQQIHLFKEGNFYRAYEQSAWLMSRFGGSELQAKKHKTKQTPDGSFVFVGFPVSSLDKFHPQDSVESSAGENHQVFTIIVTLYSRRCDTSIAFSSRIIDFVQSFRR